MKSILLGVTYSLRAVAQTYGVQAMMDCEFSTLEGAYERFSKALDEPSYHPGHLWAALREAEKVYVRKTTVTAPNGVFPRSDDLILLDKGEMLKVVFLGGYRFEKPEYLPAPTAEEIEKAIEGYDLVADRNTSKTFKVTSGRIAVSDPCYKPDTWCMGYIEDALNGEWRFTLDYEEGRVSAIEIRHESLSDEAELGFIETDIDVGVDSGQAGFYDAEFFIETPRGEYGEEGGFYNTACNLTYDSAFQTVGGGVLMGRGVVSSSGYGDGGYPCYLARNAVGKAVAAKIVFIGAAEEEDDEEEDVAA